MDNLDQENRADTQSDDAAPSAVQPAEPQVLMPAELDALKVQAGKAAEYYDQLLRTAADFDNYKKRAARERTDAVRYANAELAKKLLPVLDSFQNAMPAVGQPTVADDSGSVQEGISLIYQQLKQALTESGVEEIDATGRAFDPHQHEAVAQVESADVPEGHVLQQTRKGYKLHDRLLRPAAVIVAKAPAEPAES